jgi:predicted Zn-dependent protease
VLMFLVAIAAICFIRLNDYHTAMNSAELLNNEGKPEDAIKILERLQKQYRLTDNDSEVLNSSYLQAGLKLMKKKKFKEASLLLLRIPNKSAQFDTAQEMLRRNRHKVTSS